MTCHCQKISNALGTLTPPKPRKACKVCKPSAPRVRVGATGRAVVLSPPGSRLALKRAPKGAGGFGARAPWRTVWGTERLLPVVP